MVPDVRVMIVSAMKRNPLGTQRVLNEMLDGKKINAIKELRQIIKDDSKSILGLREAKDFIELYYRNTTASGYGSSYGFSVDTVKFQNDIATNGKAKRKKSQEYQFQGIDLRQVDTQSLKDLTKSLRKELKKRGIKI